MKARTIPAPIRASQPRTAGLTPGPQHAPTAAGVTVHLNIERLIVNGISHSDATRMIRALKAEFTRLVESIPDFDWRTVSHLERIDATAYRAGATAEEIGQHIASEIFRGLR